MPTAVATTMMPMAMAAALVTALAMPVGVAALTLPTLPRAGVVASFMALVPPVSARRAAALTQSMPPGARVAMIFMASVPLVLAGRAAAPTLPTGSVRLGSVLAGGAVRLR